METIQTATITARELEEAEWGLLLQAGVEPFASVGLPVDRDHWRIVGAFDAGRLVGVAGLYEAVHNDPWWIAPSHRRNPVVVRQLWRALRVVLDRHGVGLLHVTVGDEQPAVQAMVERLGYQPAPGRLYLLYVPDAILNEKE